MSFPFRNQKNKSKTARSALNRGITKSSNNCLTFHVSIFFSVYSLIVFNLVCCFLLFNSGRGCNVTHYTDLLSLLYFFFVYLSFFLLIYNFQLGNVWKVSCVFFVCNESRICFDLVKMVAFYDFLLLFFLYNSIYLLVLGRFGVQSVDLRFISWISRKE